jgi:hypothetical protein
MSPSKLQTQSRKHAPPSSRCFPVFVIQRSSVLSTRLGLTPALAALGESLAVSRARGHVVEPGALFVLRCGSGLGGAVDGRGSRRRVLVLVLVVLSLLVVVMLILVGSKQSREEGEREEEEKRTNLGSVVLDGPADFLGRVVRDVSFSLARHCVVSSSK